MKGFRFIVFAWALFGVLGGICEKAGQAAEEKAFPEVPRMTTKDLEAIMGKPDVIILDVRPKEQWLSSDHKIPGAVYEDPFEVKSWSGKYPKEDTVVVLY